jgi:mRNA turnover protein 4
MAKTKSGSIPSAVSKVTKERKRQLIDRIKDSILNFEYVYVIKVYGTRNTFVQRFRQDYADSKIFFGKNKIMAKALEESGRKGIEEFIKHVVGNDVGLLCSNRDPKELEDYSLKFREWDYAREGFIASRTIKILQGVVTRNNELMPHSLEAQIRNCGLSVLLKKDKLYLDSDCILCTEGQPLTSNQAKLLKMFCICLSEFRIQSICCHSRSNASIVN